MAGHSIWVAVGWLVTVHCYFAVTTEGVSCYLEREKEAFVGKARMIFSFLVTAVTVVTVIFLKNNGGGSFILFSFCWWRAVTAVTCVT